MEVNKEMNLETLEPVFVKFCIAEGLCLGISEQSIVCCTGELSSAICV